MTLQWIGLISGAATFTGVWLGHVLVRKVEFVAPKIWLPISIAVVTGLALEALSLASQDDMLSVFLGILGITLLWDGFEFWRQERRVIKGHAPANPQNPRHVRILASHPSATTVDLLDRYPVGHRVTAEEAIRLILEKWL